MRFYSFLILLAIMPASLTAKNIVLDASVGKPVAGATIFNSKGYISTSSDSKGRYTAPSVDEYPVTVRALGYKTLKVEAPVDTFKLVPEPIGLAEVTVSPDKKRTVTYVRAYMRENTTVVVEGDTLKSVADGNVEYFLTDGKAKGFKGSDDYRLIFGRIRSEQLADGVKEVVSREGSKDIFSPVAKMFTAYPKSVSIPEDLRGLRAGSEADKAVWGYTRVFTKGPEGYTLMLDPLADKELHDWSPTPLRVLGLGATFTQLTKTYVFGPTESGAVTIPSYCLEGISASMTFIGTGKFIKKAYGSKEDVDVSIYVEMIPYQIDFLTPDEAKKLSKAPVTAKTVFVPDRKK